MDIGGELRKVTPHPATSGAREKRKVFRMKLQQNRKCSVFRDLQLRALAVTGGVRKSTG
jgi:hypothetical protein